jgi:hypothetical protein
MNYCHTHNQSYPLGAHCPYCGPPQVFSFGNCFPAPCNHQWITDSGGTRCGLCGMTTRVELIPSPPICALEPKS